jgi:hypothetical protein
MDSMTIIEGSCGFSIGLINDTLFTPDSSDNVMTYEGMYSSGTNQDCLYPTRHGIFVLRDVEIVNSVCICSSGGHTGIHPTCSIFEDTRLLICCADSIFCLTVPELDLSWVTKADSATCFEIFNCEDGYIVHGELEISRIDKGGRIVWQFSGSDVFTTLTGKDDFTLNGNVIEAVDWNGIKFLIDVKTGELL